MPNTLVHFGAQGALSRSAWRSVDARWLYLGCLLPDLPWILRRALVALQLPVDTFDLRLYTMAQASLAGTLILCAALAVLTATPRLVFAVLGANTLAHLLLDACEIKWGNGVHLFAPFSWRILNFGFIPGDSPVFAALGVAGALLVTWELLRRGRSRLAFAASGRRLALAGVLLAAYFAAPLPCLRAIEASDSYSVRALREVDLRPGRTVWFDRTVFDSTPAGGFVETWSGERLRATGSLPAHDALVSLRGTFLERDVLRVEDYTEHRTSRDWPSYVALVLLAALWLPRPRRAREESA